MLASCQGPVQVEEISVRRFNALPAIKRMAVFPDKGREDCLNMAVAQKQGWFIKVGCPGHGRVFLLVCDGMGFVGRPASCRTGHRDAMDAGS